MSQELVSEAVLNAKVDNWATIADLLEKGLFVDSQDSSGFTPLTMAASAGQLEVTRLLLENGADPNIQDSSGGSPVLVEGPIRAEDRA